MRIVFLMSPSSSGYFLFACTYVAIDCCVRLRIVFQETRIGRLVNDVRRKTTDKQLGKRAKELVRCWQKVVSTTVESHTTINGEILNRQLIHSRLQALNRPPISPAGAYVGKSPISPASAYVGKSASVAVVKLLSPNSVKSSLSGQISSKPNTPSLPNLNNKLIFHQVTKRSDSSPQLNSSAKRLCISPSAVGSQPGTPDSVCSQSSRVSSTVAGSDKPQLIPSSQKTTPCPAESSKLKRTRSNDSFTKKPPDYDPGIVQSISNLSTKKFKTSPGPNGLVVSSIQQNGEEISTPTHSIETKGLKTTIRFNKTSPPAPAVNGIVETPKKRGRGRPPKVKPPTVGIQTKPQNGSVASASSLCEKRQVKLGIRTDLDTPSRAVSLTPKVKSTAELMQQLQAKNNLSVGKDTVRQIKDNLIQKEADDDYQSNVPDGAKPRHHRKKGAKLELVPPSTPVSKKEMVEKFLESSVSQLPPDDLSPLKYELPRTESPSASNSFEDNIEPVVKNGNLIVRSATPSVDSKSVISEKGLNSGLKPVADTKPLPGTSTEKDKHLTLEEIYSKYPPLDIDNFALDDVTYEMPEPLEITDDDVSRLHTQHWTAMNGCYDSRGMWRDWTQTVSLRSYNSNPLHILPYVITDY